MAYGPFRGHAHARWLLAVLLLPVALAGAWLAPRNGEMPPGPVPTGQEACPEALPVLLLEGSPYARGRQHGQALRAAIRQRVEARLAAWARTSQGTVPALPAAHALLPDDAWEQARGIADGAGVSLGDILLLNFWQPEEGDAGGLLLTFREPTSGVPYLGLVAPSPCRETVLLVHRPAEGRAYALLGHPGEVGGLLGANEAGLAGAAQQAPTLDRRAWGLPAEIALAVGLAQATTADQAAGLAAQATRGGGGALLWVEGAGRAATLVEFTAHRHALESASGPLLWQGFRDPWLAELAPPGAANPRALAREAWLRVNGPWMGREKAWAWLVGQAQGQTGMAALLDAGTARLWVAFGGEGHRVRAGSPSLEELLAPPD